MEKIHADLVIYQSENGAIEFREDLNEDNIVWGSLNQISNLFDKDKSVVSRHINNIYKQDELHRNATVAKFATVQKEGKRKVVREIEYYNLDVILSVGYRVNSKVATNFRKWATQTLKQHITLGYSVNPKVLKRNKELFLQTLDDLKILSHENKSIEAKDVLTLIKSFSTTFFNLESYDKNNFPKHGTQKEVDANAQDLYDSLNKLKQELIKKGEATELFAQEKQKGKLTGIFGSVFQTVFGEDAYPTIEQKAAHLLYFIVKNHPFTDGNKRSGAFSFIWFLQKANYDFMTRVSPETLTAITLLIAESKPQEKEKMIGIILLILNTK